MGSLYIAQSPLTTPLLVVSLSRRDVSDLAREPNPHLEFNDYVHRRTKLINNNINHHMHQDMTILMFIKVHVVMQLLMYHQRHYPLHLICME